MPDGWHETNLGAVSELITKGTTPTTSGQTYTDAGIPFLRVENITEMGGLDLSTTKFISHETHALLARSQTRPDDVLISIAGALGRCCVVPENVPCANMNQAIALVRLGASVHDQLLPAFIKYQIRDAFVQDQIRLVGAQQAQANLNLKQVGELRFWLPPLPEQRKIAAILSSVDDAIEATQAVIDQLHVVKKAMMAELLTRGLPGRHTRFKQTEIGEVPEGWEVVPLGTLAAIQHGYAFEGHFFSDLPTPNILLTPVNFAIGGGFKQDKLKYYNGPFDNRYVLSAGHVVVTMTDLSKAGDTLGYAAVLPDIAGYRFLHNQRIGLVEILQQNVTSEFLALTMMTESYRKHILATASGTTVRHTAPSRILAAMVALPPIAEQRSIAATFDFHNDRLRSNQCYLAALTELKSALSSALLTGEVRVQPDEASP